MNPEEFVPEEFSREEEEARLQKSFKDFLLVREISGTMTGIPHSSRIPAEILMDNGGLVELAAEGHLHPEETNPEKQPMVLIHRDENEEIESIEILCLCGKRTHIRLKYNG